MSRRSLFASVSLLALPAILAASVPSAAQTFTRLYSLCSLTRCTDGLYPQAPLIADSSGNFYSTASSGGAHSGGAVFKLSAAGTESVLYSFCAKANCADGKRPLAGLVSDGSGNFYGTTFGGGAHRGGTVFKLAANGTETVLHSFCSQSRCGDGAKPVGGLVRDSSGNLYGTTQDGGDFGYGTVFKLAPSGTETVLHSFCAEKNCTDGVYPQAAPIRDSSGNLYGTAVEGGAHRYGVVYKLSSAGTESVLHNFCAEKNCADGAEPAAGLIADSSGNLYGTTYYGGTRGYGTVFMLAPNGTETVVHNFCSDSHCADGANPIANVIRDSSSNLYVTTEDGGRKAGCCGVLAKFGPKGEETLLHTFCSETHCDDGAYPLAGVIADSSGNLYSTTVQGGINNGGTIFKVTP